MDRERPTARHENSRILKLADLPLEIFYSYPFHIAFAAEKEIF